MASAMSMPMQRAVRFCVKNTFIDDIDAGVGEEQPPFLPRSRTEPLPQSAPSDCEEPSGADSEGDESPNSAGNGPETPRRRPVARESGALARPGAAACPAPVKRTASLRAKDTVVDVDDAEEDDEGAQLPFPPRSRTEPVARLVSLESTDCGDDLRSDSGSDEGGSDCTREDHCEYPAHTPFAAATPTPWPDTREAQQLRFFPSPAPPRAPPPDAPADPRAAPRRAPPRALAAPGALAISARDRSLAVSRAGGACRVQWSVDAKKLRGSDKQAVSPPLELSLRPGAPPATFKLLLCPSGGDSFRKAGGVGQVQLKCCTDLPEGSWPMTAVSICVGSGSRAQAARGPFLHGFGSSSVFGAPREQADWDFGASVESAASVVAVTVEIAPSA